MFAKSTSTYRSASRTWVIHATGVAIALAVAAAFYEGLYSPWHSDIEECSARIAQLHSLLATGDKVTAEHRALNDRLATLRDAAVQARRRMPGDVAPSKFIEKFTGVAASLGVKIVQCGAGAPERRPDHSMVEVNCQVAGSFASICRCLAAVDQFPQISKVSRLEIETAPDSSAYPAQITFQLYYRHDSHDKEVKQGY